jgi:hypothetical protein
MKSFLRRIAVIVGAATLSVGLLGTPAHADDDDAPQGRDSSWGW